jgi:glucokinase
MGLQLLAGDIGGTKTKLAVFQVSAEGLHATAEQVFESRAYPRFSELIEEFLEAHRCDLAAACLGVAGPVRDGRCATTNLPWEVDAAALAKLLGVYRAELLNDLQAMALGMLQLAPAEFVELNPGHLNREGNRAVIAAGTGCGEALLYWDGRGYQAIATEGGHGDFAPNGPEQDALLVHLRAQFGGHVSYERLLSGPGLFNIYRFLREREPAAESPEFAAALGQGADPGRLIGEFADQREDGLCRRALRLFASVYGAEAGNLALRGLAVGGVFVGGGIAPKILRYLQEGGFLAAFCDKGRFGPLMRGISVKVATNPDVGLLGAAGRARQLALV